MSIRSEKIKVERASLGTLIHEMQEGELRIPRFQREFVWERSSIQKLFDSMYREYPIGTIFLWRAPSQFNNLLRNVIDLGQPEVRPEKSYSFILDGQQRLISLYVVTQGLQFDGEDYSKFVVDLGNSEPLSKSPFQYRVPDNTRWVALHDLLGSNHYPIYDRLPSEYRQRFVEYRDRLNNYPFSLVIVSEDMELEDAIEIFERINQQGKRLSRYDLITASVITTTFDLRERSQADIVDKLKPSFGKIAETSIPQALALIIKGTAETTTQMNLRSEEVQEYWNGTVESFMLAVDFVRNNLGVAHVSFLPYDAILPVLAYYFFQGQTRSVLSREHREQLERWFWRVAFSERYSGASQTRMTDDASMIRQLVQDNRLMEYPPVTADENTLVETSMTNAGSALRNGILCLLNLRRPRHFENGTEIKISPKDEHYLKFTLVEKHHIFPAAFLRRYNYGKRYVHRIPNFCFIPAELNLRISDNSPSEYMSKIADSYGDFHEFEKVMQSHFIPVDEESGIWTDDYELFLYQRARLLAEEIKFRCGITVQITEEDRDPVVDAIEVALRELIHNIFSNEYGWDYWRLAIPGDIDTGVTRRIEDYIARTPGTSKTQFKDARLKLDFCDVSDYRKTIINNQNWRLFAPTFRSKPDCETALNDFRNFRNATKHVRELDTVLDHRGQAAIIWLARALDVDLSSYGIFFR